MRHRSGFTLVEILVVVAIVAILATLGYLRFGTQSRRTARSGALRAELRNILLEQDIYFTNNKRYAKTLAELNFLPSSGTIVEFLEDATETGWHARVTNPDATPAACAIYVGTAERVPPAENSGVINCQ